MCLNSANAPQPSECHSNILGVSQHLLIMLASSIRSRMVFLHVSASTSHHSIFVSFSFPPALAITVNFFKKNSKSNADIKNTHILVFIHTTAYCFGNFVLNCRKKFSQITFLLINQSKKTKSEKHLCIHFDLEIFSHINNKKTNHKYPPHL